MPTMDIEAPIWDAKFKQRLLRVAAGVLDTPALAEEVVQEAYLRLLEAEAEKIKNPAAWLFTVTRNLSVDKARRLFRERELLLLLPGLDLPEQRDERHEIENRLAQLVTSLIQASGSHTASIVLLHVVFGVSYEDIATITGRTSAACRQSTSRALRKCFSFADADLRDEEPAETTVFVHAILDATMTPLIDNLRGALPIDTSGLSGAAGAMLSFESNFNIRTPLETGGIRQAFVFTPSGVQWALIYGGRVVSVLSGINLMVKI